ncbi:hypothetical protein EMCRGX_G011088 [Ephydatia muelleri]
MSKAEGEERPTIAAKERGPGPSRYCLPQCVGYNGHDTTKLRMPAYSFGQRLESMFKSECSPGPGYFINPRCTRFGKDGTPVYSILGRQKDLTQFMTPSPGAYYPEKVHPQGEKHAPSYTMGTRTRYRKRDPTPSPNTYTLPAMLGSKVPNRFASAAYSMAGRGLTGGFADDLAKTPGPGRYNAITPDTYTRRSPAYSMLGRSYLPGDSTIKPGPGAYSPEKVYVNKTSAPKFSMGIRHSEYITPLIVEVRD